MLELIVLNSAQAFRFFQSWQKLKNDKENVWDENFYSRKYFYHPLRIKRFDFHKWKLIFQVKAGKQQGFEIVAESNKTLADSLDLAVDPKNPYFNTMLRMIATRCMMQVTAIHCSQILRLNLWGQRSSLVARWLSVWFQGTFWGRPPSWSQPALESHISIAKNMFPHFVFFTQFCACLVWNEEKWVENAEKKLVIF